MKRILVVGMSDNIGGIETYFHNYYQYFDKEKYQFDFATVCDTIAFADEYKKNGSKIYKLPNFIKHPIKYLNKMRNIIRMGSYDVIHINMLSAANILPVKAALKENVPKIIVHSHNSDIPHSIVRKILHIMNRRKIVNNKIILRVACSRVAGEWFFGKNVDFSIIENFININDYKFIKNDRDNIRKKLNISFGEILIGNVGRLCEQKNQKFLIELLSRLDNKYKLLLVGNGEQKEQLVTLAKNMKLEDRVIFVKNNMNIRKYYSAMDLFLFPSLFEGMPLAPLEAQANGLYCLVSNSVTKDVDHGNVCFLPIEHEAWKSKVCSLANKINSNKRCLAEFASFNIDKNIKMMYDLYEVKHDIKVSVIVPAFNSKNTIKKCIQSIISQTYRNFEIIVIDDGSTDGTLDRLKNFSHDKRISMIRQKNFGANVARGNGLKLATGEYCMFIDSDDWIEPNTLKTLIDYIKKYNVDVIKFNAIIEPSAIRYPAYSMNFVKKCKLLKKDELMYILTSTSYLHELAFNIYRTSYLVDNIELFELPYSYCEDYYVNLNVIPKVARYLFIPEYFYHYNKGNTSSTTSTSDRNKVLKNYNEAIALGKKMLNSRFLGTFDSNCQNGIFLAVMENLMWSLYGLRNLDDILILNKVKKAIDCIYVEDFDAYINNRYFRKIINNRGIKFRLFHKKTIYALYNKRSDLVVKQINRYKRIHS